MPVFHSRYQATGEPPVVFHPELLQGNGPIVQVQLEAPPALVKSLLSGGGTAPTPVIGPALIDTGASVSCVDASVPPKLGVNPIGTTHLHGATGGGASSMFPMRVVVLNMANWTLDFQYMVQASLSPLGYVALLGRDVLRAGSLHYLGHVGEFQISV